MTKTKVLQYLVVSAEGEALNALGVAGGGVGGVQE